MVGTRDITGGIWQELTEGHCSTESWNDILHIHKYIHHHFSIILCVVFCLSLHTVCLMYHKNFTVQQVLHKCWIKSIKHRQAEMYSMSLCGHIHHFQIWRDLQFNFATPFQLVLAVPPHHMILQMTEKDDVGGQHLTQQPCNQELKL